MEIVLDTVDTNNKDYTPCVIPNQGASPPKQPTEEQKKLDTELTNKCNGK